jgi:hypothetical protein
MKFTKATIVQRGGPDLVSVITDLPDPIPVKCGGSEFLIMDFKTPPGKGDAYCRDMLGITDVEIIVIVL